MALVSSRRSPLWRPLTAALACAALTLAALTVAGPHLATPARADDANVTALAAAFEGNHSEKQRLAAVTALAKLGSKATLRPLVTALRDPAPAVRALAASALARLGNRAALPALRAAQADADPIVQKRAAEAVAQICVANNLPVEGAAAASVVGPKPGFGSQPRAVAPRPDLFVVIKSASDDSPGKHDKRARKVHADALRATMTSELTGERLVTLTEGDAKRFGLDPRHLDLSIVGLEVRQDHTVIEVEAQVRLAISDDHGKMLSFVSGGAKVQVPRRGWDASYLPKLRRDAVENAVRGVFAKVIDQLRRSMTS